MSNVRTVRITEDNQYYKHYIKFNNKIFVPDTHTFIYENKKRVLYPSGRTYFSPGDKVRLYVDYNRAVVVNTTGDYSPVEEHHWLELGGFYYEALKDWSDQYTLVGGVKDRAEEIRVRNGREHAEEYLDTCDEIDDYGRGIVRRACEGDETARKAVLMLEQGYDARSHSNVLSELLGAGWGCPYVDDNGDEVQTWCWEMVKKWLNGYPYAEYENESEDPKMCGPTILFEPRD